MTKIIFPFFNPNHKQKVKISKKKKQSVPSEKGRFQTEIWETKKWTVWINFDRFWIMEKFP